MADWPWDISPGDVLERIRQDFVKALQRSEDAPSTIESTQALVRDRLTELHQNGVFIPSPYVIRFSVDASFWEPGIVRTVLNVLDPNRQHRRKLDPGHGMTREVVQLIRTQQKKTARVVMLSWVDPVVSRRLGAAVQRPIDRIVY